MNRWQLGNYQMTINPAEYSLNANAINQSQPNLNGQASNTNLYYTKQMQFQIDVYEDRTSVANTLTILGVNGFYVSASEDRVTENMYMLTSGGTISVLRKDNTVVSNLTIAGTTSITLPSTKPNYICKTDNNIALLYVQSTGSQLVITDDNANAISKYTYSNVFNGLCWDFNNTLYTLDPNGRVYSINLSNGASTLFTQMDDYLNNVVANKNAYTSVMMCDKQNNLYLVMLKNKNMLIYIRLTDGKIINNISTIINNVVDLSYSNYSGDSFILVSKGLYKITPNTARLDIDIIKNQVSDGQVTVLNEHSIPTVIYCDTLQIQRLRNMNESRYQVMFNAYVAYERQGWSNSWNNIIDTITMTGLG